MKRVTLDNGLRLVMAPERQAGLVSVVVCYGVGSRAETRGQKGLAHLFEHLMFQGSPSAGKMQHVREVEGQGGILNASARPDYTYYWQTIPPEALSRVLFLEADRMRGPILQAETLTNQVAVVKEEIRGYIDHRPYRGFPWYWVQEHLFDAFPNIHHPYGDPEDLDRVTLADVQRFSDLYHGPANALLAIGGNFEPQVAVRLVQRHFGDLPSGPTSQPPATSEPPLQEHRRGEVVAPGAPAPAVALAWRLPVGPDDPPGYLAFVVVARLLGDGQSSRLHRRLVDTGLATQVAGDTGFDDRDCFDVQAAVALVLHAHLRRGVAAGAVVAAVDEEIERLAECPIEGDELEAVRVRLAVEHHVRMDRLEERTLRTAYLEWTGSPRQRADLPGLLSAVTASRVSHAAAVLRDSARLQLDLVPGATP